MRDAPLLSLSATITKPFGRLEIHYQLDNRGDAPVYVFDVHYHVGHTGARRVDPDAAYVRFEGLDTVHVTRSMIPIPRNVFVESPEVPYATLLGPAAVRRGRVRLPVPLREHSPYVDPPREEALRLHVFPHLCFSVGVVPLAPGQEPMPLPHLGEGIVALRHGDVARRQILVETPRWAIDVKGYVAGG